MIVLNCLCFYKTMKDNGIGNEGQPLVNKLNELNTQWRTPPSGGAGGGPGLKGEAESEEVAPVRRAGVVAERHTAAPGAAAPAAATVHAVRARGWARGIGLCVFAIIAIPILAPLPHIAAHVVKAKFIGGLGAYWMCRPFITKKCDFSTIL